MSPPGRPLVSPGSFSRIMAMASLPAERPFAPGESEPEREDAHEHAHLDQGEGSHLPRDHGPREHVQHLDVEEHEEQRESMEADVELDLGGAHGGDAALV